MAVNKVGVAPAPAVAVTVAEPLSNALEVPTFVAVPIVGVSNGLPASILEYLMLLNNLEVENLYTAIRKSLLLKCES